MEINRARSKKKIIVFGLGLSRQGNQKIQKTRKIRRSTVKKKGKKSWGSHERAEEGQTALRL